MWIYILEAFLPSMLLLSLLTLTISPNKTVMAVPDLVALAPQKSSTKGRDCAEEGAVSRGRISWSREWALGLPALCGERGLSPACGSASMRCFQPYSEARRMEVGSSSGNCKDDEEEMC